MTDSVDDVLINIDINSVHAENGSHNSHDRSSVPKKLKSWYTRSSFRSIILSVLSILSIILSFIGLYSNLISSCETLGFISSIIFLFAPSPLSSHK